MGLMERKMFSVPGSRTLGIKIDIYADGSVEGGIPVGQITLLL